VKQFDFRDIFYNVLLKFNYKKDEYSINKPLSSFLNGKTCKNGNRGDLKTSSESSDNPSCVGLA